MRSESQRRNFIGGRNPKHHPTKLFPLLSEQNSRSRVVVCGGLVTAKTYPRFFSEKIKYAEGFNNCDIGISVGSETNLIQRPKGESDFTNSQADKGLPNLVIKAKNSFSDERMKLNNLRASSLFRD